MPPRRPTVCTTSMPGPGPTTFTTKSQGTTTLEVTTGDGVVYEVKLALLIPVVFDTGLRNPIDDMPIFTIPTNAVVQVKRLADA